MVFLGTWRKAYMFDSIKAYTPFEVDFESPSVR
jgi:hypothetical protein